LKPCSLGSALASSSCLGTLHWGGQGSLSSAATGPFACCTKFELSEATEVNQLTRAIEGGLEDRDCPFIALEVQQPCAYPMGLLLLFIHKACEGSRV
jgi:hypothetical protein